MYIVCYFDSGGFPCACCHRCDVHVHVHVVYTQLAVHVLVQNTASVAHRSGCFLSVLDWTVHFTTVIYFPTAMCSMLTTANVCTFLWKYKH